MGKDNKKTIGKLLEFLGTNLQDEHSQLYSEIEITEHELVTLFELFKVLASPPVRILYIGDLAMRFGVTNRTIQNWIHDHVIPRGRESDTDNRMHWLESEVNDLEADLIKSGYVKPSKAMKKPKRMVLRLNDFIQ